MDIHCSKYTSENLHFSDSDHHGTFAYVLRNGNFCKLCLNAVDEIDLLIDFNSYDGNTIVYYEPRINEAVENLVQSVEELIDNMHHFTT